MRSIPKIVFALAAVVLLGSDTPSRLERPQPDDPNDLAAIREMQRAGLLHIDAVDPSGSVAELTIHGAGRERARAHLAGLRNVRKLSAQDATDEDLVAIGPWPSVRELDLEGSGVTDAGLAHLGRMRSLDSLNLGFCRLLSDAGMAQIARLRALRSLSLEETNVTDEGLRHLAGLARLEALELRRDKVGDAGLRHLAGLKLQALGLFGTRVTDRGIEALQGMASLRRLDLRDTKVTNQPLIRLKGIRGLDIIGLPKEIRHEAPDDPADAAAIIEARVGWVDNETDNIHEVRANGGSPPASEWMPHLKGLHNLQGLGVPESAGPEDMAHLRGLKSLSRLEIVGLGATDDSLANLSGLTNLRELSLYGSESPTGAGLAHLASLVDLESLNLRGTAVADDGLRHLAGLKKLRSLNLSHTRVTDAGLADVAKLASLEYLDLGETAVSDAGLAHLRGLRKLRSVLWQDSGITEEGVKRFWKDVARP